jgi:deoxyhypusine synthase
MNKQELLSTPVRHIDITQHDPRPLIDAMRHMAFSARDLARAADIYERMVREKDGAVILCLAGSLISAGLKKVFTTMLRCNMVDAIVSTGANIVDQDFFEALGFGHWQGEERLKAGLDDNELRELHIDRIYDTLIDEDDLRICDETVCKIADGLEPGPYTSRRFIREMGAHLVEQGKGEDSIVRLAFENDVPIFCPAFSDSSAGLGMVAHYHQRGDMPKVTFDSAGDFYELTQVKIKHPTTGLFMIGGGVPKNFAQDIVVAADILGHDAPMHKYAIQVTVADVRDGALSGSTLKEASSWGKVSTAYEQMVYSEATLAVPLIVGYGYHTKAWEGREARRLSQVFETAAQSAR